MPLLNIILPYRDAQTTLDECLDSITAQTLQDYRLLAIDDHSEDGSRQLIQDRARVDSRILPLINPGRGLVDALNYGLRASDTSVIARMDADDKMYPQRLERQHRYLQQHSGITLLGCATRLFPSAHLQAGLREYIRWQNTCNLPRQIADEIYIESPFAHPSIMFRRQVITRLGGYRQGPFPEDYDLWLRLHQAGESMAKLPEILLEWRDYPQRTSRCDPRCSRSAFDQLRARYLAREPRLLKRREDFVIWGAGRRTRQRCQHLLQRGFCPKAWIDIDPRKIGNRLRGIPVVGVDWLDRPSKPFVLVYVTNHGAREQIAEVLQTMGYSRGTDYLMVG